MKPTDSLPASKAVCCDDLFADYDLAAERLAEAREILALGPESKPAKERVDDALKRVYREIGKWIERTRSANAEVSGPPPVTPESKQSATGGFAAPICWAFAPEIVRKEI